MDYSNAPAVESAGAVGMPLILQKNHLVSNASNHGVQSKIGVRISIPHAKTESWPVHCAFSGGVGDYAFLNSFGRSGLRPSLVRGDSPRNAPLIYARRRVWGQSSPVLPAARRAAPNSANAAATVGAGSGPALYLSQKPLNSSSHRWHELHAKRFPPQKRAAPYS